MVTLAGAARAGDNGPFPAAARLSAAPAAAAAGETALQVGPCGARLEEVGAGAAAKLGSGLRLAPAVVPGDGLRKPGGNDAEAAWGKALVLAPPPAAPCSSARLGEERDIAI